MDERPNTTRASVPKEDLTEEEGGKKGREVHPEPTTGGAPYGNLLTKVHVPTNQRKACAIEAFRKAG